MNRALCVGLNYTGTNHELTLSQNDAKNISGLLKRNEDGSKNFDIKLESDKGKKITKSTLKKLLEDTFKTNSETIDTALFFFSGHGYINDYDGYLVCSEAVEYEEGLEISWILQCITHSHAKNKVILLDCCFSGMLGKTSSNAQVSKLPHGITILTSSNEKEPSYEGENFQSVFTELLSYSLEGENKDLFGNVTASNIYSCIDSSLGPWEQRPVFKTNISKSVVLRKCIPKLLETELISGMHLFETIDSKYPLSPEHEPNIDKDVNLTKYPFINEGTKPDEKKVKHFKLLQKLVKEGLVKPTSKEHMFYEAIYSGSCELTGIGKHHWRLVDKERI